MELKVIGSSSNGNCYLLQSRSYGETLILEAGVKPFEVAKAMNWDTSSIVGCVITHRHKDHAKYVVDNIRSGIYVLGLQDVWDAESVTNRFAKVIESRKTYKFGHFEVLPLPVLHDVPCVAYLIKHPDMGKLIFITDTMSFNYKLPVDVNHIMIEANYSDKILMENIERGVILPQMRSRLTETHMELETTANVFRRNNLPCLQDVVLVHLSNNNSNAKEFREYIKGVVGAPTFVAEPGMVLDITDGY